MTPTLLVGDLILVNKFTYGLRLPVLNTSSLKATKPSVAMSWCFASHPPSQDYIKRAWSACPATPWRT